MGFRLFVAAAVSLTVYLLMNLVLGSHGVTEYEKLTAYRERLESNIASMEATRGELSARAEELRGNAEAVRLEARRLGFYRDGELPLRVEGFSPWEPGVRAGTLLTQPAPPADHQPLFRVVSLSAGLIAFFLLLL